MSSNARSRILLCLVAALAAIAQGCTTYTTPGAAANLAAIDRSDVMHEMARAPAATFPARLAILRLQAPEYRSHSYAAAESFGRVNAGAFSVVTVQELLRDEQIASLEAWPSVAGVAPVSRLVLPPHMNDLDDLRLAAAKLQADVLVLYTLSTQFEVRRKSILPTGVISLGVAPDRDAHVTTTASALLVDVRTGFVHGLAEATARKAGLASFWSSAEQLDAKRIEAERAAFDALVGELAGTWRGIVQRHAGAAATPDQAISESL